MLLNPSMLFSRDDGDIAIAFSFGLDFSLLNPLFRCIAVFNIDIGSSFTELVRINVISVNPSLKPEISRKINFYSLFPLLSVYSRHFM